MFQTVGFSSSALTPRLSNNPGGLSYKELRVITRKSGVLDSPAGARSWGFWTVPVAACAKALLCPSMVWGFFCLHLVLMIGLIMFNLLCIDGLAPVTSSLRSPLLQKVVTALMPTFHAIDIHTMKSMHRIIKLYEKERVDSSCFHGVDGYGYGDYGRDKFDNIVAALLGAEAAMVRIQFFSGTHAIATSLFACLRPGDEFLCVSGHPYDTLEEVIGLRPGAQTGDLRGSLADWGIKYHELPLLEHNNQQSESKFDLAAITSYLHAHPQIKLLHIQRYY
jgi:hypothetical protein